MFDSHGLIHTGRTDLAADQLTFAVDAARVAGGEAGLPSLADPVSVARAFGATVLVGTTGTPGAFGEPLVRAVAANAEAPIILPLSNPGDRCEAIPDDVLRWTDGRALVATGSPFPVAGDRLVGQANNVFIFPGVGLGAVVAEAREVTDDAFLIAADELAGSVSAARRSAGAIYPPISDLRPIARRIAIAVVRRLRDTGYGRQLRDEDIEPAVDAAIWTPEYLPYRPA
jgi:malic enzyme